MPAPNSQLVADRAAITRTVTTAADKRGDEIAGALEPLLFPDGIPSTLTLLVFIHALAGLLARIQSGLEANDAILAKEIGDDMVARDTRDGRLAECRKTLVGLRATLDGLFGPVGLARAGLSAAIPSSGDALVQLALSAADQIEANDLGTVEGVTLDRATIAAKLRTSAGALRASLDAQQAEERETQAVRGERDADAELWLQVYPGVADVLAGLAFMVGRTDIAERVRPTARRRAGEPEPVDLEPVTDPLVGDPGET